MHIANNKAAKAYAEVVSKLNFSGATVAQEVVMLEKVEQVLRSQNTSAAIFEFGRNMETGELSVETVGELLNRVFSRKLVKSQEILAKFNGRVCDLRRELLVAEMELET